MDISVCHDTIWCWRPRKSRDLLFFPIKWRFWAILKYFFWKMSIFDHFSAKYDPQTPQKGQNSEKAHWHDYNTHVYGPFEGSDRSEELEAFWGIWIIMKKRWIWSIYIGSPLWKLFFRYFFKFFNFFSKITQKSPNKDMLVNFRFRSGFFDFKSKWPIFTPQGAVCTLISPKKG